MAFSYWESNAWLEEVDLLVVGAGIVGLSAALHARSLHPDWCIVVVDADPLGGGGSSRNAGFSCFGSATELRSDRQTLGDEAALALVSKRWQGLQRLRSTFGDNALGHRVCGSVELFPGEGNEAPPSARELEDLNRWIQPVTGVADTFTPVPSHTLPHLLREARGPAILSRLEGLLDTGKMNRAFRSKAHASGIDVLTGIRVESIDTAEGNCQLKISTLSREEASIRPARLVVATNALGSNLIPGIDVEPAVNHVLVTDEIPDFEFPHAVHIDAGYVYARPIENRMLIGGGRHWGFDETATRDRLMALMYELWPATEAAGIAYQWSGLLGVGTDRSPIVKRFAPNAAAAVRLGGMGVAIGMEIGRMAAEEIAMN